MVLNGVYMRDDNASDPADIQIKDEIKNLINKREGIYKSALVITALCKIQDSWRNVFTKITLLNKDQNFSEKLEYDNFILSKVSIPVDEFSKMLDDLILKGDLNIMNCPDVKATGTFDRSTYWRYRSSNDEWVKNEWPTNHYIFNIGDKTRGQPPSEPLVSASYPHFPRATSAIKYYTDIDVRNQSSSIFILLPNYQLKIDELIVGSEHLNLKITINGITQEELIGKLYYEKEGHIKIENFQIDKNPKRINIGFIPDMVSIYLLKNDGEILDFRESHLKWPSSSKDVLIEVKERDVIEMIKQGENQRVEFKRELNKDKEKEEFTETVVAFANGGGGAIFLGVDDKTNVVGFHQEKIEETIISILRSRCEPSIEPDIKTVTIDDKQIVVIRINEGKNKPYTLKERGVYVRSGSSDRIASRMELDEFYEEREKSQFEDSYL